MSRPAFTTAYSLAQRKWQDQSRRLRRVSLARPTPLNATVALRPAEVVPFTPPAVSILAPKPETDSDIKAFVRAEFAEASRKRDRTR